jgi:CRP-like cAMP-binding protein
MATKSKPAFNGNALAAAVGRGTVPRGYPKAQPIFSQGDPADAVFFVQDGKVKLTVLSHQGKQAVIALLGPGDFFGEGCLAGQPLRMATAIAMTEASIVRLPKQTMIRVLHRDPAFSEMFTAYLLSRNVRMEEDLVDQLFDSSEKRLARILLLLANFGKPGRPELVVPKISQETLAEMVGTTRSRISFFMNKFRKLGFVQYNGRLEVHSSLLHVVLHD